MIGGMTYELCFLPSSQMLYQRQNCTRLTHEEISEYYTDEDKKMCERRLRQRAAII
mgnify:CR=1 FL=1